jgi:putative transposase
MSENQANFPIKTMARVLGVSRAGYLAWRRRPASPRVRSDAELLRRIRTIHAVSQGTYGAPRIHAELRAEGLQVARKRVARLMRAAGLAGVSRRRGPRTTIRDREASPAPDLVQRKFSADAPDRLWVADIT